MTVSCPHCGVTNPAVSTHCDQCLKMLPALLRAKPRIVGPGESPLTPAGIQLVADAELRWLRSIPTFLAVVAALGVVVAGLALKPGISVGVSIVTGTGALITFLLSLWAQSRPQTAMVGFGVVLFVVFLLHTAITIQDTDELATIPHIGRYVGAGWVLLVIVVVTVHRLWNQWQCKPPRK
jgi:hypothetical protein